MSTSNELVHYPSCVVNLQLTVDPKLYIRVEEGGGFENQNLVRSPNNGAFILNRVPKKCNIQLQGHTQAATYKLIFDYRELPIDPRTIIAATAEVYLGTVSASDFADGMNREVAPGIRKSILRTRNQDGTLNDEFLVLLGPVDDWSVKHNEGASEVHLEGRDLRGIFLDSPLVSEFDSAQNRNQPSPSTPRPGHTAATPNRRRRTHILDRLRTDVAIHKVVEQLIYQHDTIRRLPQNLRPRVIVRPEEWPNGIVPSPGAGSHIPRHRRGANGQGGGGGGAAANMNFWDAITRYCQTRDALVCKSDLSWAPIGTIKVGDKLLGFAKNREDGKNKHHHKFAEAEVQEVFVRTSPIVKLHMESGRVVKCTPDHHWFTGRCEPDHEFKMPKVGRSLIRIVDDPKEAFAPDSDYKLGYIRGLADGDGCYFDKRYENRKYKPRVKHITLVMKDKGSVDRYVQYCKDLGLNPHESVRPGHKNIGVLHVARMGTQKAFDLMRYSEEPTSDGYLKGWLAGIFDAEGCTSNGLEICQVRAVNGLTWERIRDRLLHFGFNIAEFHDRLKVSGGRTELLRFFYLVQPAAVFKFQRHIFGMKMEGKKDKVVRIEECGEEEEVISLKTSTGTYLGQGYASRNCYLVGAIPTFQGRNLIIRPGYALFDRLRNIETPFRPNESRSDGLDQWNIRRMVWGRDIESLELGRKYAGHNKPKTVRCISVDPSAGTGRRGREQLLEASWPPRTVREARREGAKDPRNAVGGEESQEIMNIPVHGVRDIQQLTDIARSFYEQLGRLEMKGSVSTSKLTSFGGTNADPDLLRLRVGDPVELLVDASRMDAQSPIVSTLNQSAQLPFSQAVREVQRYIPDENLCRAIVASARGNIMGVLRYFRVGSVDFDWSYESVEVKADIQNYFTPRWDRNANEQQAANRRNHPVDHARGRTASQQAQRATNPETSGARMTALDAPTPARGQGSDEATERNREDGSVEDYMGNVYRRVGQRW